MSYPADDIRSQLATGTARPGSPAASGPAVDAATPIRPAQWIEFLSHPATETTTRGSRTWIARASNLVISYTEAKAGDVFARTGQADEYAILQYSASAALTVTAGVRSASVAEEAFVVVPPGDSQVRIETDGILIRLFSHLAGDLAEKAVNADAFAEPDPRVTPLTAWPDPPGGFTLRVYPLAGTPIVEGRFGRIFRTTNLMVNFLAEEPAPRNPHKLSPHHHDDFEQISLAVTGRFLHHIRYPWGPDSAQWRDDERREIATPSICVIPPPTVHTTQGIGPHQQLIDIFSPPRADFSSAGWVVNADDYPSA